MVWNGFIPPGTIPFALFIKKPNPNSKTTFLYPDPCLCYGGQEPGDYRRCCPDLGKEAESEALQRNVALWCRELQQCCLAWSEWRADGTFSTGRRRAGRRASDQISKPSRCQQRDKGGRVGLDNPPGWDNTGRPISSPYRQSPAGHGGGGLGLGWRSTASFSRALCSLRASQGARESGCISFA